jgi:phosphate transport system substrate-binding protein
MTATVLEGTMNRAIGCSFVAGAALFFAACATPSSAGHGTRLTGAGSTFAYPLYSKWADAFGKAHPDVQIDYQSIGSGGGIGLVTDGRVDFGATDGPLTDAQIKTFVEQRGCDVVHLPMALGADVATYNLPGVSGELKFTPRALVGIFLGTIKRWNDPEIAAANPGVALPSADIVVIHRSDGSGTTYVWTDYLSKVSDEWQTKVGRAISVSWPVGTGASGNQAVADLIASTPRSLGYVELTYAIRSKLSFGQVQNSAGQFVKAELSSVTAAAAEAARSMPDDFRVSITNAPGESSYPISSFTWVLVPAKIADTAKRQALVAFLKWGLADGQAFADSLSYSRLPDAVIQKTQSAISRIQ